MAATVVTLFEPREDLPRGNVLPIPAGSMIGADIIQAGWQKIIKILPLEDNTAPDPAMIELPIARTLRARDLLVVDTVGRGFFLVTYPGEKIFGADLVAEDGLTFCRRPVLQLAPVLGEGEGDGWAAT
jgi:hypothetical protein